MLDQRNLLLVLLSATLASVLPAAGQDSELPEYDAEAHCKKVASFGGPYSAAMDAWSAPGASCT